MNIVEFVGSQVSLFNEASSDEKITWHKESQFAIQAFQKNDYLAKIAISNPTSAQNAIINVAAIGITLNPSAKLAYLVPRDGGVHLDISYMGLMHLAMATGSVLWGQCKLVYSADTYESNGLSTAPSHKYNPFGDRGEIIGGYCTVKTSTGDFLTDEMSMEQILTTAKGSKSYNARVSPWKSHFDEMARKTIVKRASKYWPKVERLDNAISASNEIDGIELEPIYPHYSDEQRAIEVSNTKSNLKLEVKELCFNMANSKTIDDLKLNFSKAFKLSRDTELQQEVQEVYAKCKSSIEVIQ